MEIPKISVIVLCNELIHINQCIDSLLNQTYKNLEILIVLNKKDKTSEIIKRYEKNETIRFIYNDDSQGCLLGFNEAAGEYIGYVSANDYIENDYYEKLMQSIIQNNSEVALCDIKLVSEKDNQKTLLKCYKGKELNLYNILNTEIGLSLYNKLFKRTLIEQIFSKEIYGSSAITMSTLVSAKKISYANDCYYISNNIYTSERLNIFNDIMICLEQIKNQKDYEKLKDALIFNQIIILLIYLIPKEKNIKSRKQLLKNFHKLPKEYNIMQNNLLNEFLSGCGKKHKLYYKWLFKFTLSKKYFLANLLIMVYNLISNIEKRKTVLKEEYRIDDIIRLSKKQSKMKTESIKVSVVIPNYNYAKFLYQRIYSILNQNYKIYELIILDDCSKDNSQKIIDEIEEKINKYIKVKKIYNEVNSGSAFKQWNRGFKEVTGDYVWIAEADDYCEKNLLKNLTKPCKKNNDIMISYCDMAYINSIGNITVKSIKIGISFQKSNHWNKSYINEGIKEVEDYVFLNNTIVNVSGCIIKNGDYSKILEEAGNYRQAGDWLFYVNVMINGKISYVDKILNYYRIHGDNISAIMNKQKHIDEINDIYKKFIKQFNFDDDHKEKMKNRIDYLKKNWYLK